MSATSDKRKRGVRVLGLGFLALLVLLIVLAITAKLTLGGSPSHWDRQQERIASLSSEERKAMTEDFRNRLMTAWSDAGPEAPTTEADLFGHRRTLEIPYEKLNIWLAEEGIDLLDQVNIRMPKYVKAAMIDSDGEGRLRISCDVDTNKIKQVVALTFAIQVDDNGTVTSTLEGASAGKLPIPTETAVDLIARRSGENSLMLNLMQGTPVGPIELPIDASDSGRDGRLVGMQVRDDALVITRETVRRKKEEKK